MALPDPTFRARPRARGLGAPLQQAAGSMTSLVNGASTPTPGAPLKDGMQTLFGANTPGLSNMAADATRLNNGMANDPAVVPASTASYIGAPATKPLVIPGKVAPGAAPANGAMDASDIDRAAIPMDGNFAPDMPGETAMGGAVIDQGDQPAGTTMWGNGMGGGFGGQMNDLRRRMRTRGLGGGVGFVGGERVASNMGRLVKPMQPAFDPITGERLGNAFERTGMGKPVVQQRPTDVLKPLFPANFDPKHPEPLTPEGKDPWLHVVSAPPNKLQPPKITSTAPVTSMPAGDPGTYDSTDEREQNPIALKNGGRVRRAGLGKRLGAAEMRGSPVRFAEGGKVTLADLFRPSYSKHASRYLQTDESGTQRQVGGMNQDQWDALTPEQQLLDEAGQQGAQGATGGGVTIITPHDPRYRQLAQAMGDNSGKDIRISNVPNRNAWDPASKSKPVDLGNGFYAFTKDQLHPLLRKAEDEGFDYKPALMIIGGILAAGAMTGALAGGAEMGGVAATDAAESGGTLMLNEAGTAAVPYEASGSLSGSVGSLAGDESAGLNMTPGGEGAYTPLDESAGLNMNPGDGTIPLDESAGLDMSAPEYGIDTTQINPIELQKVPEIQDFAAREGMSVTDWLKNPKNLASAAKFVGGLAASGAGNSARDAVSHVELPGVTSPGGTTTPGAAAPGGGEVDLSSIDVEGDPLEYLKGVGASHGGAASGYIANIMAEAANRGSDADQQAAAGKASADVAQRFANQRKSLRARMIAQGMNPDDPRGGAGELDRLSRLDETKAAVGASNIARSTERDKGFNQRAAAAGLGLQQSGQDLQADSINANVANSRARLAADLGINKMNTRTRVAESAADRAWRTGESAADRAFRGSEAAADRGIRVQQINANIDSDNNDRRRQYARDVGSGVGAAIDLYGKARDLFADGGRVKARRMGLNCADGGDVSGPGTSTSDSIPAKLSDGEFVVNAEAVALMDKIAPGLLEKANARGLKIRSVRARGLGA